MQTLGSEAKSSAGPNWAKVTNPPGRANTAHSSCVSCHDLIPQRVEEALPFRRRPKLYPDNSLTQQSQGRTRSTSTVSGARVGDAFSTEASEGEGLFAAAAAGRLPARRDAQLEGTRGPPTTAPRSHRHGGRGPARPRSPRRSDARLRATCLGGRPVPAGTPRDLARASPWGPGGEAALRAAGPARSSTGRKPSRLNRSRLPGCGNRAAGGKLRPTVPVEKDAPATQV